MNATSVTVIVPTFDHVRTLELSLPTALAQTHADLDVIVVGDGAPDETRRVVEQFTRRDRRVRYLEYPKGPRNGELHRHHALMTEASGDVVFYLSDDDLWLSDHVATMLERMRDTGANFVSCQPTWLRPDGGPAHRGIVDLGRDYYRNELLEGRNRVALSCGAHTMQLYRGLPHGWRTTPPGTPTDLYMWQQLLAHPECRAASTNFTTVIGLPDALRGDMTPTERYAELLDWSPVVDRANVARFQRAVQGSEAGLLEHARLADHHQHALGALAALDDARTAVVAQLEHASIDLARSRDDADALRVTIVTLRDECTDLRERLQTTTGSRGWRALERLRRARNRLFV